jgi:ATP-binding protein involved in chromosome partitioning
VVVTTPSSLATVDVVRGVAMLQRLRVPVLALIENMASFECGCGEVHRPFGRGHLTDVLDRIQRSDDDDVPTFSLPIVPDAGMPTGIPRVVSHPSSSLARELDALAASLERTHPAGRPVGVTLPHGLRYDETPHWPTEMAVASVSF